MRRHRLPAALTGTVLLLGGCGAQADSAGSPLPPAEPRTAAATSWPTKAPATERSPAAAPARMVTAKGHVRADELRLVQDLVDLARSGERSDARRLPFADHVALGLGSDLRRRLAVSSAHRWSGWRLDARYFAGRVGPLSVLKSLGRAAGDGLIVTAGPHRRCAGPAFPPPAELAGLRRLAIRPTTAYCLDWFSVDLFLDRRGRIAAVTLDLWEP